MIRKDLVGTIFGIEFIPDSEIKDDDVLLVLDAHLVDGLVERRFGEGAPPPLMTKAAIGVMRGKDFKKKAVKASKGSKHSIRLVPLKKSNKAEN